MLYNYFLIFLKIRERVKIKHITYFKLSHPILFIFHANARVQDFFSRASFVSHHSRFL